jgi:type I protein arginine methyltransferase
MYSLNGYASMIADDVRTGAYVQALREAIKPGSIVLDIGTGTGFFALLACRFGARRVFAIECSDVIDVARRMAVDNHCAESIDFIQAMSTEISLPEQADVIVSDLRGILPFFQAHLPAIADARRRFLAPGGALIPACDTLWVACVEAPELHRHITTPWSDNSYGLDMRAARDLQANRWRRAELRPDQMVTRPERCATIDYGTVTDTDMDASLTVSATRAGVAHGLCVWFDATLAEGIHFSNSPTSPNRPSLIYGSAFFPWPEPVALDVGDTIAITIRCNLIAGDYFWAWETRVATARNPGINAFHFRQSDLLGEPMSLDKFKRRSSDYVPKLNPEGRIDRLILELMGEEQPLGEIARQVALSFPDRFAQWQDALPRVGEISCRYSRSPE